MTTTPSANASRSGAWIAGLALVYGLLSVISILLAARPGQIATLWFANSMGVVALLALPRRRWALMLAALGLANLLANAGVKLPSHGLDAAVWQAAAAFVPGNCAEMLLGAMLLSGAGVRVQDLQNPSRLLTLFVLGAVIPALFGAVFGAAVVAAPGEFGRVWATWLAGSLIGGVAMLPLSLSVWLQGLRPLQRTLAAPQNQALLLLTIAATLVAATTLPHPFVVMAMALGALAAVSGLLLCAVGTLLVAMLIGVLIGSGVLLLPPASGWWSDSLYYGAVLSTLLPGTFLAATVDSRRDAMLRVSTSEAQLRSLYQQTPALLQALDERGRVIDVSELWLSTLGYTEGQVQGRPITDFLTPESGHAFTRWADPGKPWSGSSTLADLQMLKADGSVIDAVVSAIWELDDEGRMRRLLAVVEDVTEKKKLTARSHFAEHDALTGLPNRVLLQDRLERLCANHSRQGGQFAVAFLDLDHFKAINDTHGHEAGDRLLKAVAERLLQTLRASDTVARLGGDEFVLLLSALEDRAQVELLARKVLEQVAQPCTLGDAPGAPVLAVGCSLGIALYPDHGQDAATLMLRADQAMYAAKRSGRNRWVIFHGDDAGSIGRAS
ncbi:MAG: diguanylate cyclase domain-containing protein [Inhella sp.]|uniref:diguanylate cyclase domain-containing protein n=1 Tax=Inhella sp. TaxID=1921806 RepID=UPI00391CAF3D